MTGTELAALVGRVGTLQVQGLRVPIVILDAKRAYGCTRYWVTPHLGTKAPNRQSHGAEWVSADRVTLEDK